MDKGKRKVLLVVVYLLAISGCKTFRPKAELISSGGSSLEQVQAEPYSGPKARVAVRSFVNKSTYQKNEFIGKGIAEMMATALFHTHRFVVLERERIGEVFEEQELASSDLVKREAKVPCGEIEGAELLITGAVTEFHPPSSRGGRGVLSGGWYGGDYYSLYHVAAGVARSFHKARVTIEVKVYDVCTSRVVCAVGVKGSAADFDLKGFLLGEEMDADLGKWSKTSMDKAIRAALEEAVKYLVENIPKEYFRYQSESVSEAQKPEAGEGE